MLQGFVTLLYQTTATIKFKGYVYNVLKKISDELDHSVQNMSLTKDSKVLLLATTNHGELGT